jgi:hypothetical protein
MQWITRERPKIDRIACPWLIRRFIDENAEFLYVPKEEVFVIAEKTGAVPFDIPGAELSHVGEHCSFDAFLQRFELRQPALQKLAVIIRGADTDRLDLAPQAAGLVAVSMGLASLYSNDQELLRKGMELYDALYAWCLEENPEKHSWNSPS